MRWLGKHKLTFEHNLNVVQAYNKMHACHRMQMERGIGHWSENEKGYEAF
jgi:hypothetical protein